MRKRAFACVLAVLATCTLSTSTTNVTAAPAPRPVAGNRITLITGDVVTVIGDQLSVQPVNREAGYDRLTRHGDQYVIPGDAAGLIGAGKLDLELFNVTGLIRQGYDDARSDSVPLLVEQAVGIAGARTERTFGELNLAVVSKAKKEPSWRQIAGSGRKVWLNAGCPSRWT